MPPPTATEFWSLLVKSGLVDAAAAAALRREHEADPARCGGGTSKGIAAWLADRGAITRWQAKRLGIGNLGPFFLGDYRLLERHEREGDALLFTARHEPSGRIVSVVLLNAKCCKRLDVWTEIVQRTTAASQVTDPMLSRTWSLEQHEASRLIVCEHVEGVSLAEELGRHGALPAVQAGVLVSQIARAVAEVQSLGGPHGGLSLEVLRREPPPGGVPRTGRVRLLQFPLAGDPHRVPLRPWADDAELASLGRAAAYVAPELMLPGSVCDFRTDVYSIGAILYALVSGSLPCWEGDAANTLKRAAFGAGPAPLGPPAVTSEMATLIGYLMARDPAERYQTAAEAADGIAACLGLATGTVRPPATAQPRAAVAAAAADELPDFLAAATPATTARAGSFGGGGTGPAVSQPVPREPAGPSALIRRRRAQMRLFGGAVTLAILAGTAALVVSRLDWKPKPDAKPERVEIAATTAAKPAVKPAEESVGWGNVGGGTAGEKPVPPGDKPDSATEQPGKGATPAATIRQLVVDDPTLPWASPTEGPRPRLAYLTPGSQLVLLARPADLLADDEGRRFVESLGPQAAAGLATLASFCGCEPADIELLQAGWQAGGIDQVLGGYAVRLAEGRELPTDEAARRTAWGATTAVQVEGETIHKGKPFSFWVPSTENNRVLVVAPEAAVEAGGLPGAAEARETLMTLIVRQAVASRASPADGILAELPLELEQLVGMLDETRHVTLFGSPHYLLTQGRVVLAGPLAKLAKPLESLFGESLQAAALSVHIAGECYLELDAIATRDVPPKTLAEELSGRVDGLPDAVENYCVALNPAPYGKVLVSRLPAMLRSVVAQRRSGAEGKGVVINTLLPRPAAHNIALASELALAQAPGATVAAAGPAAPAAGGGAAVPAGALGKLEQKITLVFAKDTLEKSIQMISDEIGTPMDIVGPDLQLEGITKNQSFGLEARDKSAREVLLEILARANPDGKLVYIVRQEDGVETILVTTRAAVQKRGDKLPPGLEAPGEDKEKKNKA